MNIDQFKPDDTGKFSPLLYRYLKRNEKFGQFQVWQRPINEAKDEFSEYWAPNHLIVGHGSDSCAIGRSLGSIIRGERGVNGQSFAYAIGMFGLRNITKEFWEKYASIGRCAWDAQHRMGMVGDGERFTFTDNGLTMTCNWCGKIYCGTKRVRVERHRFIEWKEVA